MIARAEVRSLLPASPVMVKRRSGVSQTCSNFGDITEVRVFLRAGPAL
jgi:hypothetical protein